MGPMSRRSPIGLCVGMCRSFLGTSVSEKQTVHFGGLFGSKITGRLNLALGLESLEPCFSPCACTPASHKLQHIVIIIVIILIIVVIIVIVVMIVIVMIVIIVTIVIIVMIVIIIIVMIVIIVVVQN